MENTVLELTTKIKQLEQELKKLKDNNGYGLSREDKPEEFEAQAKNALPILQEEHSMRIENDHHLDHLIIQGDNFHSLSALNYTHRGLIDVIYIDPPYNTGNKDFIYNDSFVDKEDSYRHSKRLSFINKRLKLAKNLLSDKGVIFISIDDNEQAPLKLLCDDIFGEENFVTQFIWEKIHTIKANSRLFSVKHDYISCYAKNISNLEINSLKRSSIQLKEYKNPDNDIRGVWARGNLLSPKYTESNDYEIEGLEGKIYKPKEGTSWRYKKEKILELMADNRVKFEPNSIRQKLFLSERAEGVTPESMLFHNDVGHTQYGTEELKSIFGDKIFDYPKPTKLIKRFIERHINSNATILDFFAGSGTTGHAVLELNQEDGGERKFILCSNRENTADQPDKNICKDITYERVKRVMTGYHNSKGEQVAGLGGGNLRYYTTQFVQTTASTDDLRYRFIHLCDDLLCIKEDTFTPIDTQSHSQYLKIFQKDTRYTIILYETHYFDELLSAIEQLDGTISVYIFALSKDIYEEELLSLNKKIIVQNIPDDILQTYKKIFKF